MELLLPWQRFAKLPTTAVILSIDQIVRSTGASDRPMCTAGYRVGNSPQQPRSAAEPHPVPCPRPPRWPWTRGWCPRRTARGAPCSRRCVCHRSRWVSWPLAGHLRQKCIQRSSIGMHTRRGKSTGPICRSSNSIALEPELYPLVSAVPLQFQR